MSGQRLAVIRPVRRGDVIQTINQFQSDATEIDTEPEPLMARAVLFVVGVLVIFAIIWASIATIDRIVTGRGRIITVAPTIVVQPFEPAIIKSIDVKVGDVVKAGSVLATLDPTFALADVEQIGTRIQSLDAVITRLEAEQNHQPYTPPPGARSEYAQLQEAIWRERQTQFTAQIRNYDERMARSRANIEARERERGHLRARLTILNEVEEMRVALESTKSGSRLNSLLARDSRIEVERALHLSESSIIESRHEFEALQAERDVFRRQWESKVVEELVTKRNERDSLHEQLTKARRRQDMIQLRPPVDGIVLEVAPRSVGSVVNSAEAVFKLVPLNAPLEIEADIEARQLGYIAVGDPVQIKFDSYTYQEHGMAEGRVRTISSDAFSGNRTSPDTPTGAFYKVRIEMTSANLRNVPDTFQLIPGMPLTAEIKVGQRSVIAYLLRPILRGLNESMREP